MLKFNVSSSLKNNKYLIFFIISSLINSAILLILSSGIKDIRFLFCDLAFILLISSFSYLVKRKDLYFLILSFLLSTICCLNSLYYNNFMDYPSICLISDAIQALNLPHEAITGVFNIIDFIFYWQFIVLLIFRNKDRKINKINFKRCLISSISLFVIIILTFSFNDLYRIKNAWNRIYVVRNFGVYNYQTLDLFNVLDTFLFRNRNKKESIKDIDNYFNKKEINKSNEYTNMFKDKNLIFIHAESVQSMFLFNKLNDNMIMPNLSRIASEGLYFNNYYSEEGVGTSSDTELSITNSILPVGTGTTFINYYKNNFHTMLQEFKNKNYYTFSMHGNTCEYWNRNKIYPQLGYDHFYCYNQYDLSDKIGIGLSDKSFFSQSVDKISNIKKEHDKFLGTLIMLTNHTPFINNGKVSFDVDYMEGTKMGNYIKLLHYVDEAFDELFKKLDNLNILDDTVIVIYGDHDAKFSKEEYEYYLGKKIDFYEYEKLTRVPLIIWSKDLKGKVIEEPMGAIDIYPTLANMFGIDNKYTLGNDIFSTDYNLITFPNGNWLTKDIYYNNQLSEYKKYNEISNDKIKELEKISKERIEISNKIIRYNYFK